MLCPFCNTSTSTVTLEEPAANTIRRRRQCMSCELTFTTYEQVYAKPLIIVKKNGRREMFARDKLRQVFFMACSKRSVPSLVIDTALDYIETVISQSGVPEVESGMIGRLVANELHKIDKVAYIRFAASHSKFRFDAENLAKSDEKETQTRYGQMALIPQVLSGKLEEVVALINDEISTDTKESSE